MDILSRIHGKTLGSNEPYDEKSLIELHHYLMKEYGWIPLEEFKKLPMPTVYNLLYCIKKDKEREKAEADKIKTRRK